MPSGDLNVSLDTVRLDRTVPVRTFKSPETSAFPIKGLETRQLLSSVEPNHSMSRRTLLLRVCIRVPLSVQYQF